MKAWIWRRRATGSWSNCSCTRTSGTCGTPGGCCKSGPRLAISRKGRSRRWSGSPSGHEDETRRLRGLWALYAVRNGGLTAEWEAKGLQDKSPFVRAWAIRLMMAEHPFEAFSPFGHALAVAALLDKDPSPVVRLALASALQRMPAKDRWYFLERLVAHGEDATDPNLPLMYWYAAEPLADLDAARALKLAANAKIPLLLPFMVRRVASAGTPEGLAQVVKVLAAEKVSSRQLAVLDAIHEGLKGRRRVEMPKEWPALFAELSAGKDAEVRRRATALAVTFGDPKAFADLRRVLTEYTADAGARQKALASLLGAHDERTQSGVARSPSRQGAARRRSPRPGPVRRSQDAAGDLADVRLAHPRGEARRPGHTGLAAPPTARR